jgi:hypothetical protein
VFVIFFFLAEDFQDAVIVVGKPFFARLLFLQLAGHEFQFVFEDGFVLVELHLQFAGLIKGPREKGRGNWVGPSIAFETV